MSLFKKQLLCHVREQRGAFFIEKWNDHRERRARFFRLNSKCLPSRLLPGLRIFQFTTPLSCQVANKLGLGRLSYHFFRQGASRRFQKISHSFVSLEFFQKNDRSKNDRFSPQVILALASLTLGIKIMSLSFVKTLTSFQIQSIFEVFNLLTNSTVIIVDIFFRKFCGEAIKTELFGLVHGV